MAGQVTRLAGTLFPPVTFIEQSTLQPEKLRTTKVKQNQISNTNNTFIHHVKLTGK